MDLTKAVPEQLKFWEHPEHTILDEPEESVVVTAIAIAAGVATRHALRAAWKHRRGKEPPINPAAPGVTWSEAITWGAAVGAAVGVSRVLSRRSATATLQHFRK